MERDFMGLNSKEEAIEAVLLKSSAYPWSLSNGYEALNNRQSGENQKSIGDSSVPWGPVQLTIFYGGMVNVYNNMSPEKAQAIMLLAGNGARAQAQVTTPGTPAGNGVYVNQPMTPGPSTGTSAAATDAPKVMGSLRRVMQSGMVTRSDNRPTQNVEMAISTYLLLNKLIRAVPQMRGASLARFLEKRRERVMASAPYNLSKSSSDSSNKASSSSVPNKDEKK